MADLWEHEEAIAECAPDIDVPAWIEDEISPSDVAAIVQGGCASGAYMPAVTYASALGTMARYGDDVLQFLQDNLGELPKPDDAESWSGMACFYLSAAVDLWAASVEDELETALDDAEAESE